MIAQAARLFRIFVLTITVLGVASACSTTPQPNQHRRPAAAKITVPSSVGERAAAVALDQVGTPYRYGGSGPDGFDCSGLVQYSYSQAGVRVPRTTGQLWSATQTVKRDALRVGDLLFFSIEGKMSHVGMYLGGQRFVHAPSSGRSVSVATLNSPFYEAAFIRAGRPK